jgi:hypothetical protein
MNRKRKGSNAKRTPSQNRITGKSSTKQRYKNQSWEQQFKRLDLEFDKGYFTMKTISIKTGIDRANICRYIQKRRKQNKIYLVQYAKCPITGSNGVGFYTANFDLYNQFKAGKYGN